jgi:hypothetical protein
MVATESMKTVWTGNGVLDVPCQNAKTQYGREEYWCGRPNIRMDGKRAQNGTPEALIQNYENVFDDDFLEVLKSEAEPYNHATDYLGTLKNNKRATFYMPAHAKPRTPTEVAVLLLRDLVYPGGKGLSEVKGMKYWYQYRGAEEDIGFHYDKDEGMASDQMIMRFPYINTLVYLTDEGAPTIFFNQTVIHNGNIPIPHIADSGWLVYPKRNKWTLQRGDLLHGAQADMALVRPTPQKPRITLVVSFEDEKPVEPNCHYLTDDELPEVAKNNMKRFNARWTSPHRKFKEVKPISVDAAEWNAGKSRRVRRYEVSTGPSYNLDHHRVMLSCHSLLCVLGSCCHIRFIRSKCQQSGNQCTPTT